VAEQSSADFRGNLGRYALFGEIAQGGMATVHLARQLGPVGFARTVAIKRLHPHLAKDPDFVAMFLEEARLAARVHHPNVVSTLDVVSDDGELFLVMEYVPGESLSRLVRKTRDTGNRVPPRYVIGLMCGALEGLHAAHEAKSEKGVALGMVHRDVSPQNIHCGVDGIPRVLDFGIAKATNRVQETRTDQIKGKVAYMSPEQLAKGPIDRRADVYSACVVLWEALTGQRLFKADDIPSLVYSIMNDVVQPPSEVAPELPKELDAIIMKGLDRESTNRWESARELAAQLEKVVRAAPAREIGAWIEETAGEALQYRLDLVHRIESETSQSMPPPMVERRDSPFPLEASGVVDQPKAKRPVTGPPPPPHSEVDDEASTSVRAPAESLLHDGTPAQGSHLVILAMALVGLLLVGGGALLGMRWMQMQTDGASAPAPSASASAEPAPSHEPAIVIGAARSASAPPVATSVAAPVVQPVVASSAKPKASAAAVPVKDDCENPFVVDKNGIRHPKPHCFKK
jgi:eukaryotic-like serine/threonine-protein kinase